MSEPTLPPEARIQLLVRLDALRRAELRCSDGIRCLTDGRLTREAFVEIVRDQEDAHRKWIREYEHLLS